MITKQTLVKPRLITSSFVYTGEYYDLRDPKYWDSNFNADMMEVQGDYLQRDVPTGGKKYSIQVVIKAEYQDNYEWIMA